MTEETDERQPDRAEGSRLPPPSVPEAPDGFYDDEEISRLTVSIAPYPGMAANDVVTVHLAGFGTLHREPVRIRGPWVGGVLAVRVAKPYLSSSATRVHYEVAYAAGGTAVSEPLMLNDR